MIDTQAKPLSYIRLLVLVVLLGAISAVITFAFIALVHLGTDLVWNETKLSTGLDPRLFTLLICTLGGLLVGLLVRWFGDITGIFAEVMLEFGRTGRFEYRNAPGMVVTALVSLIAGASLGPEAPLADACGGTGTWLSDRLKLNDQETRAMGYSGVSGMLAAFITAPLGGAVLGLESAKGGTGETRKEYFWVLFPSLLASAAATVVFVLLSGVFFQTLYQFPDYIPRMNDLFFAVPLGMLGGVIGMLFLISLKRLQQFFQPMKNRLVLRGLIGGLGMGVIGALLPLTLFSGEEQIVDLMSRAAEIGVVMLIILSLAKLFATSLLLATGWKGGYIFPSDVCQRCDGPGGGSVVPPYSSCGDCCGNDGRRAGRRPASALVCGTLHHHLGAKRDGGRRRRCSSSQCAAHCPAGAGPGPAIEQSRTEADLEATSSAEVQDEITHDEKSCGTLSLGPHQGKPVVYTVGHGPGCTPPRPADGLAGCPNPR